MEVNKSKKWFHREVVNEIYELTLWVKKNFKISNNSASVCLLCLAHEQQELLM